MKDFQYSYLNSMHTIKLYMKDENMFYENLQPHNIVSAQKNMRM